MMFAEKTTSFKSIDERLDRQINSLIAVVNAAMKRTTLAEKHEHPHSEIVDCAVGDQHTQYLLASGARQLAGDWYAGQFDVNAKGLGVVNAAGAVKYQWAYNATADSLDLEYTS
jgi:hypothetical protein